MLPRRYPSIAVMLMLTLTGVAVRSVAVRRRNVAQGVHQDGPFTVDSAANRINRTGPFVRHLGFVIRKDGGVFVRDERKGVYSLSSDLQTIQDRLLPENGSYPVAAVLTRDGSDLVVSWNNGTTAAYNTSDLSSKLEEVAGSRDRVDLAFEGEDDDLFLLKRAGSLLTRGNRNDRKYQKLVLRDSKYVLDHEYEIDIDRNDFSRTWVYGFVHGSSQYMVVRDFNDGYNQVRVIRTCGGENGGWYEVNLTCGRRYSYTAFSHTLMNATYLRAPRLSNASSVLMIAVRSDGEDKETRVCSYSLSDIEWKMKSVFESCKAIPERSYPVVWDNRQLSGECKEPDISECELTCSHIPGLKTGPGMLAVPDDLHSNPIVTTSHVPSSISANWNKYGNISIFIGMPNGIVKEYVSGSGTIEREWEVAGCVAQLKVDVTSSTLYVLTSLKIFKFPLSQCSQFTTCGTCTAQEDSGCGWCGSTGRCGTLAQCPPATGGGLTRVGWTSDERDCTRMVTIATRGPAVTTNNTSPQPTVRTAEVKSYQSVKKFLRNLGIGGDMRRFLAATATVLALGEGEEFVIPPSRSGGLWYLSEGTFNLTKRRYAMGDLSMPKKTNITWTSVQYGDLDGPLYSALAAFLYIKTLNVKPKQTLEEHATFFVNFFVPALTDGVCLSGESGQGKQCSKMDYLCKVCSVRDQKLCSTTDACS